MVERVVESGMGGSGGENVGGVIDKMEEGMVE